MEVTDIKNTREQINWFGNKNVFSAIEAQRVYLGSFNLYNLKGFLAKDEMW